MTQIALDLTPQDGSALAEAYAAVQTTHAALEAHRTRKREYDDEAESLALFLMKATIETTTVEAFVAAQARRTLLQQASRACALPDIALDDQRHQAIKYYEWLRSEVRRAANVAGSTDALIPEYSRAAAREHLAKILHSPAQHEADAHNSPT